MLSASAAAYLTVAGLGFDLMSVLALMYPGRERVEITASDGTVYVYACKPGPGGETLLEQAEKAQEAFETNLDKFAEALVAGMMEDIETGEPALTMGLSWHLKTESWAGAITTHMQKEYGCALLG
jgi:hypothetical protein